MDYTTAHSPKWANAEKTIIDLFVNFVNIGEVPFGASSYDSEQHSIEIFNRAAAGEFGIVADFIEPELSINDIEKSYKAVIDKVLDDAAKACNYDNIMTACSYTARPGIFQAESISFFDWRTAVWAFYNVEIGKILSKVSTMTISEFVAALPERIFP